MTITRSTASQNGRPPWPGRCQIDPRLAEVSKRMVIQAATLATTHAPNRSSHRRITRMGPPRARAVDSTTTPGNHSQYEDSEENSRLATRLIAQNSNPVHPTSWTILNTDGT